MLASFSENVRINLLSGKLPYIRSFLFSLKNNLSKAKSDILLTWKICSQ